MNLFESLGPEVVRDHFTGKGSLPHLFFWGEDAASQMARALVQEAEGRRALVLYDERTRRAGAECLDALRAAGWELLEKLVPEGPQGTPPVCDDLTQRALFEGLPKADVFVAVGSGVVNDLTKWLAFEAGVPYAVYATAASMNGYAAANVAPSIRGVKSLIRARAPRIIAANPNIVSGAPFELTSAGLGDLVAKPVSTTDWLLNHRLTGEAWSPSIAQVIDRIEPKYLENPEGVLRREPAAMQALFEALVFSGCAMTLQGSSLPASGGEHLVSHTLDMMSHQDGRPHDLHGRQVGVATLFVAELYQRMMRVDEPSFSPAVPPFDAALWGSIGPAVHAELLRKRDRMEQTCRALARPGSWEALRRELMPRLRDPGAIKSCLKRAGGAHRIEDLGCSRERFLTAVRNCSVIRARFTSIDLANAMGLLPGCAEEIVEQWLV